MTGVVSSVSLFVSSRTGIFKWNANNVCDIAVGCRRQEVCQFDRVKKRINIISTVGVILFRPLDWDKLCPGFKSTLGTSANSTIVNTSVIYSGPYKIIYELRSIKMLINKHSYKVSKKSRLGKSNKHFWFSKLQQEKKRIP